MVNDRLARLESFVSVPTVGLTFNVRRARDFELTEAFNAAAIGAPDRS
jgi:hypothetical protein